MRTRIGLVLLSALLALAPATASAASAMTSAEIVENGLALDGERVTLVGEAIGEDLRADTDYRWVNLRSGGTAVGVYASNESVASIETYGSYVTTGDTVSVTGILHVACDRHGGEFDVHAESLTRGDPGRRIDHQLAWWKGIAGLAAAGVGLVEWRLLGRRREREDG